MPLTRRDFLKTTAAATTVGCVDPPADPKRPNVLVVFVDQLRSQALSRYGETNIETPRMDALLAQSSAFTRTYTSQPVCIASRASLFTGLFPHAIAPEGDIDPLRADIPLFSDALALEGWSCGYVGKWHLAAEGDQAVTDRRSFDWFQGFNHGHLYTKMSWFDSDGRERFPEPADRFQPEYQNEHALSFIDAQDADQPWLLVLSYGVPHPPRGEPTDWSTDLPERWFEGVPAVEDLHFRDNVPELWRVPAPRDAWYGARFLWGYYAATRATDYYIGSLLDSLDERGLSENTIVVFVSDHGEHALSHGLYGKRSLYEEACRIPLSFRWPGTIEADIEHDFPVSLIDLPATVLGLCGVAPLAPMQGRNLAPWLLRPSLENAPGDDVFVEGRQRAVNKAFSFVATTTHKLSIENRSGERHLFDLRTDPYELNNLTGVPSAAGVEDELSDRLEAAWRQYGYPNDR